MRVCVRARARAAQAGPDLNSVAALTAAAAAAARDEKGWRAAQCVCAARDAGVGERGRARSRVLGGDGAARLRSRVR